MKYSIAKVRQALLLKASKGLVQLGKEWRDKSKELAPTGPTGRLKTSLVLSYPVPLRLKLSSRIGYALTVAKLSLRHVPRREVGRLGWHDYGARLGPQTTRFKAYYRGLRAANRADRPARYVWHYANEALRKMKVVMRYRDILS
jgi:hypothetical protein